MQSILTKYKGPTNTRSSRMVAECGRLPSGEWCWVFVNKMSPVANESKGGAKS